MEFSAGGLGPFGRSRFGLAGKQRTCRRLRLLARSAPLGRSRWPLAPARLCLGARNRPLELARLRQGCRNLSAWLLESTALADVFAVEPARLHWGARHWRSGPLGFARASKSPPHPHLKEQLRIPARLERPCRASCGSRPRSSGHFEPAAAPGQARPTISSHLRFWAKLEVGNLGRCGVFEQGRCLPALVLL